MHDVKTLFDVWVHDTIYSDEFRAQIEDHVRTLQAKTNQKVSEHLISESLLFDCKGTRLLATIWLAEGARWREWRSIWGLGWSTYWPETRGLSLWSDWHDRLCAQWEWGHHYRGLIKSINATGRRVTDKHAWICSSVSLNLPLLLNELTSGRTATLLNVQLLLTTDLGIVGHLVVAKVI